MFTLIFPPASEATLFPYLSLPALAGVLGAVGVPARQLDLNLALAEGILQPDVLDALRQLVAAKARTPAALEMRKAVLDYARQRPGLWRKATCKAPRTGDPGQALAIRMVKRVLDVALECSSLGMVRQGPEVALATWRLPAPPHVLETDPVLALLGLWAKQAANGPGWNVYGFSVPFFDQILGAAALAAMIRAADPIALIVLGGPQVWLHFDQLKAMPALVGVVDGLCYGPGEETVASLAALEPGQRPEVPNLEWLPNVEGSARPRFESQHWPNLESSPDPEFEGLPLGNYLIDEVQFPLITCLGCYWGRCTFCSYGSRHHQAGHYQELSPERLAGQCLRLIKRFGAKRINFVDENTNLRLVVRAMRILQEQGGRIRFSTRNRLERCLLNLGFCRELRDLGCELMSVGFETSSQRLLDKLQRGLDASTFQPALDNLHQAGINVRVSVMGAILDETREEAEASLAFLERNQDRLGVDTIQKLVLEPMTPLALGPAGHGIARMGEPLSDWNRLMNFGVGRVGASFQPTLDHGQEVMTEAAFASLFADLEPQGNDERPSQMVTPDGSQLDAIRLHPWVKAWEEPQGSLLVSDLSWQRFHRIAPGHLTLATEESLAARTKDGRRLLSTLASAGYGEAVLFRGGQRD